MELLNKDVREVTRRRLEAELFEGAVPEAVFLDRVLKAAGAAKA
jgi:hypothetical protein